MPRRSRFVLAPIVALAIVLGSTACGSSSGANKASGSCGPVKREAFDSRSLQHILPGTPTPKYQTDPPTSGPHQPSPPVHGVQTSAIPKPVQVGILEGGNVLVQYRGLDAASLKQLRALGGPKTVIAPNPDLKPGQVVVTAWLHKQTCSAVDPTVVRAFVKAHASHGPDYHATS